MCFSHIGSALLAKISLSWKGLQGTNTLAYYEHSSVSALKSFIRRYQDGVDIDKSGKPENNNDMTSFRIFSGKAFKTLKTGTRESVGGIQPV